MKFNFIYLFIALVLFSCKKNISLPKDLPATFSESELQILNWLQNQQMSNGLLQSVENGNVVSLYDNALAALVFMLNEDYCRAENIFDYFDSRIDAELTNGVGGFSQLRDSTGNPNNKRWMGDNAWLLIALNNYKARTGKSTYDHLASELSLWLQSLQDTDGGLFAGYNTNDDLMTHKVTEGMMDAFNAIDGYTSFHSQLLNFLEADRWDSLDNNLVSWPTNPAYLYAMDLHPWSYLMLVDYPTSSLTTAERYLNTQTAINGVQVTGYCFDVDNDAVWFEGTGQMALAFGIAGMENEKATYLTEMEKVTIQSTLYPYSSGFPYASNLGTAYGAEMLWNGAESKIAISGGAWYVFAKQSFNPFAVGRDKDVPSADIFW